MKLSEFDYVLPKELIAQQPLEQRDSSRLMVIDRRNASVGERRFSDVTEYLKEGDCLVLNNTKVIPSRLYGKRATGARVEIFLLDVNDKPLRALVRPSARIKEGEEIYLENGFKAIVLGRADAGRYVEFNAPLEKVLEGGHVPLPPYIERDDNAGDRITYQTVYASENGATAAPTAGLHFSAPLIERISEKGVKIAYVTLHTGYGTFAPVKEEDIDLHQMHSEKFEMSEGSAKIINSARRSGGKIFAVGTTSTRVLESSADAEGFVKPQKGSTKLFIYPGYRFKMVDGLVTNFHLPGSTLLMLVSAFAGMDLVRSAYKKAVEEKYRFFSYGDAMLIL